jgi:hypothetical protein
MNAPAGPNPEAPAVTEVIFGGSEQATQAGPVRLGDGEVWLKAWPYGINPGIATPEFFVGCGFSGPSLRARYLETSE